MPINKGLMSSKSSDWCTPKDFFTMIDDVYKFDLDPCATKENAMCPAYFTKEDDGLTRDWFGAVYMNPPYGREIGKWIQKAYEEVQKGNARFVVCLLPARTDTKWFHDYCVKGEIHFIKGRLKFSNKDSAPFPSMLVKFVRYPTSRCGVNTMERR